MMLTLVFLRFIGEKFEDGVENLRKNLIREGLDPDDEAMQKKWKAFCRKTDIKTDDYSTVLKAIRSLLSEPFAAAVEGRNYVKRWSGSENKWS